MRTFTRNFSVAVIWGPGGPNERSRPGESSCDWSWITTANFSLLGINSEFLEFLDCTLCLDIPSSLETLLNASDSSPLTRSMRDGTAPPLSLIHIKEMQATRTPGSSFLALPSFHTCQKSSFYFHLLQLSATFSPNSFFSLPWLHRFPDFPVISESSFMIKQSKIALQTCLEAQSSKKLTGFNPPSWPYK